MITPMKKVTLIMMDQNRDTSLEQLRDLGIVHLQKKTVVSAQLTKLIARQSQIETAAGILDVFSPKKGSKTEPIELKEDLSGRVMALYERRKKLEDYMFNHQRERSRFEKWGNFNPKDFAFLAEHGVNAFLYELPMDTYQEITKDVPVFILTIDKKNNTVRLVAFEKIPDRSPYPLPERSISMIEERNSIRKAETAKIEAELASLSLIKNQLKSDMISNLADIEFETARTGMEQAINEPGAAGAANLSVSLISGYVPAADMDALKKTSGANHWALVSDDPAKDDTEVPTKLKNNHFVQLIYPVTDFLEMIPGYHEKDISLWFLIFFTIFFGMIFGDAAYGIILMLIAVIGILKTRKNGVPIPLQFLLLISISNTIWGTLICSWFGLDVAILPKFLQNISLPPIVNISTDPGWLASYNASNFWIKTGLIKTYTDVTVMKGAVDTNLMLICFSIALVHLSIAHIVNAKDNIRSPFMLAEIGRILILLGMFFVVLSLIVFNTGFEGIKAWQLYLVAAGFALVFVFGYYQDSLAKSVIESCKNFITVILNITNIFSDIMSYIRLWAVGLAAASLSGIINEFAGPLFSKFAFFILGIAFFAFGHGFNMVLNVLSVLVHGVRLNTLEFSSHIGLSWSGSAYKPFAKRKNNV